MLNQHHNSGPAREEAQSPLRQAHTTILILRPDWKYSFCLLGTWLRHFLGGSTMALGRSQTEMRVQTLSKVLGAKAKISPGRRLESRQRPPCHGLCPGFPLTLEVAVEDTLLYNFCFSASLSRKYSAPRQQQSCSLSCCLCLLPNSSGWEQKVSSIQSNQNSSPSPQTSEFAFTFKSRHRTALPTPLRGAFRAVPSVTLGHWRPPHQRPWHGLPSSHITPSPVLSIWTHLPCRGTPSPPSQSSSKRTGSSPAPSR